MESFIPVREWQSKDSLVGPEPVIIGAVGNLAYDERLEVVKDNIFVSAFPALDIHLKDTEKLGSGRVDFLCDEISSAVPYYDHAKYTDVTVFEHFVITSTNS